MATAADILIDTLATWGRCRVRTAGRRHQRDHGGAAQTTGSGAFPAGPPRGIRRLHGLRLCQMDRQARRLSRDLRGPAESIF